MVGRLRKKVSWMKQILEIIKLYKANTIWTPSYYDMVLTFEQHFQRLRSIHSAIEKRKRDRGEEYIDCNIEDEQLPVKKIEMTMVKFLLLLRILVVTMIRNNV